jgi:adenosylcobyric acid synthase
MGKTLMSEGLCPAAVLEDERTGETKNDGICSGNVCGTYVHGVFDTAEAARGLLKSVAAKKGIDLEDAAVSDYSEFKESQYDLLAKTLREHLDMEAVYRILEEGV